jgi:hypothetical protein
MAQAPPGLKLILITNRGGNVVFSSEIESFLNPGITVNAFGGLIIATQSRASATIGGHLAYLSLTNFALTIVTNPQAGLFLTVVADVNFPRALSHEIGLSILRTFSERWNPSSGTLNDPGGNRRFQGALGPAIRLASTSIFHALITRLRGVVLFAVIFSGDGDAKYTYPPNTDSITVGAALQQLQMSVTELAGLARRDEVPYELVVESEHAVTRLVFLGGTTLFIQIRATSHSGEVVRQVKETIAMVELCLATSDFFMA